MPVVAIHTRDQRKAAKIIKTFYLKYPLYRFVSFKDMHGMTEKDFAKNLSECALSVWVDDDSTFGTFPIESIMSNVPVIGKVPNIIPEWITDDNGVWVYDENQIPDLIFNYIKNWMEDTLPENLINVSEGIKDKFTMDIFEKSTIEAYNQIFERKIKKLNKIKQTIETNLTKNEE
jgi:glycosyltransferase involved in cell wall biosynthesis